MGSSLINSDDDTRGRRLPDGGRALDCAGLFADSGGRGTRRVFAPRLGGGVGLLYGTPMQGEGVAAPPVSVDPVDDARLISAVVKGDRGALAALYDRHSPILLALGVRVLSDRALAEDVLHDVFLEAWHHAAEFDGGRGSVRAWLITRMRSRCLDRRGKVVRGARLAEAAARESSSPAPDSIAGADRERVRRGVAGLSPELTAVIDLAYFDGLSASEIAERLGLPVGTVKSRLARAIATLRAQLHPESGPPR
jgi:RNA polymerase sigma-70 factor (ECF subfamily)